MSVLVSPRDDSEEQREQLRELLERGKLTIDDLRASGMLEEPKPATAIPAWVPFAFIACVCFSLAAGGVVGTLDGDRRGYDRGRQQAAADFREGFDAGVKLMEMTVDRAFEKRKELYGE